jgi:hypothetical protein
VAKALQSRKTWGHFGCLLHGSDLGLSSNLNLNRCPFRWWCPVGSPISILSWFLFKISESPALLAEGVLRKPLACLCPRMDCQYSICFLYIQPLITSLAILAEMPRAGWGPISECEEPYQASWSAISFPSIPMCPSTHTSWTLLCSASLTRDWWQSQTTHLELIWKLLSALMAAWLSVGIYMFIPL